MLKISALALSSIALLAPATAMAAPPTIWIADAKLVALKLAAKEHAKPGECHRINRLAVDCTAVIRSTEKIGDQDVKTIKTFRTMVRRTEIAGGYRTSGQIKQISYREDRN